MESVAGITWNEWPVYSGIGGRNRLEYAAVGSDGFVEKVQR
ncbi:hypothetical protein UWK_02948 [Desulfocapsa sulfexigens DSM 10523]|uniref:Uncharacterized protein n=1 Tax=Desulfocapsa sulfexigens (strain DSM 10523 / SB164P1) TaxID=1167006 RepID=M1P7P8_DESSD|nr:hypothetical protein UWK_02948 [Desulfocapsa sulfexigens DSM 10523]